MNPLIQALQEAGIRPSSGGQNPPKTNPLIERLRAAGIQPSTSQSVATPTETTPPQEGGFLEALKNIGARAVGAAKDIVTGAGKGALSTLFGIGKLETKIPIIGPELKKVAGYAPDEEIQMPESIKPKGILENLSYGGEQIGEFFLPGGIETKGIKAIDTLVDSAKFAERYGPKAGKAMEGILKVLGEAGVRGGSMGAVSTAQTGKPEDFGAGFKIGAGFGAAGKVLEVVAPGYIQSLIKANFKLTPSQEVRASSRMESAAKFMQENNILGSPKSQYQRLLGLGNAFENIMQSSLPENAGVKASEIKAAMKRGIESLAETDPAVYKAAKLDMNEASAALDKITDDNGMIKIKNALNGKRSWGKQAFKNAKYMGTKIADPRVSAEGAYAAELAYQSGIENTLDRINGSIDIPKNMRSYFGGESKVSFPDFNKVYSNVINSRSLSFNAQFKKDTGLIGRLAGLWIGEMVGESIVPGLGGKVAGAITGEYVAPRIPTVLRGTTERFLGSQPESTISAAKLGTGFFDTLRGSRQ